MKQPHPQSKTKIFSQAATTSTRLRGKNSNARRRLSILISNDDGVHAPGIQALYRELKKIAQVVVVAPLEERSTTGHSLTLHKPLRLVEVAPDFYGVSGSPADCVYLGLKEICQEKPDWVISGINRGANLGQDIHYSGTVSAAREACIAGIAALAVSLDFQATAEDLLALKAVHYQAAAQWASRLVKKIKPEDLPAASFLNLNVPFVPKGEIQGLKVVKQGFRFYQETVVKRRDHRGKFYYWVGGKYYGFKKEEQTDCAWIAKRFATLTPLKIDSTDELFLRKLGEWDEFQER